MMKLFGIVDKRVPGVVGCFTAPSSSFAAREIQKIPEDRPEHMFSEDYSLWLLADIDEDTYVVTPNKEFVTEFETLFVKEVPKVTPIKKGNANVKK